MTLGKPVRSLVSLVLVGDTGSCSITKKHSTDSHSMLLTDEKSAHKFFTLDCYIGHVGMLVIIG